MPDLLTDINGAFSITHQAVCRHGDFDGGRHGNIENAYIEANQHNDKPGCEFHLIDIITHQQMANPFISPLMHQLLANQNKPGTDLDTGV